MNAHRIYKKVAIVSTGMLAIALLTFSAIVNIIGEKVDGISSHIASQAQNKVRSVFRNLNSGLMSSSRGANIPIYHIGITSKNMRIIEERRKEALKDGVLLKPNKTWVSAQFVANDMKYGAKVRLRGDMYNHWDREAKSWRVKFDSDNLFERKKEINLVLIDDKAFEVESVAYEIARRLGLVVPEHGFVRLFVNNVDHGVYFWHEQVGKEALEKQGYPEGEIITSDNAWLDTRFNGFGIESGIDVYPGYYVTDINNENQSGRVANRWRQLLELTAKSAQDDYNKKIETYINVEKFAKWSALCWIFGSSHAQAMDNVRWYYNTTTGLFEPLIYDVYGYDLGRWDGYKRVDSLERVIGSKIAFDSELKDHRIVARALQVNKIQQKRNKYIWEFINDKSLNIEELMTDYYQSFRSFLKYGPQNYNISKTDDAHQNRIGIVANNRSLLKAWLSFSRTFSDLTIHDEKVGLRVIPDGLAGVDIYGIELELKDVATEGEVVSNGVLTGLNLSRIALKNQRQKWKGNKLHITFDPISIYAARNDDLIPEVTEWRFDFNSKLLIAGKVKSYNILAKNSITQIDLPSHLNRRITAAVDYSSEGSVTSNNAEVSRFVELSGIPFVISDGYLSLAKGTYKVNRTLSIPREYGLKLGPGVRLVMGEGVSIVVHRDVQILGSPSENVIITGDLKSSRPWGTLSVVNASAPSKVLFLRVSGGSEAWINGIFFSGQLNFYSSDVDLRGVLVSNAHADDAMNIKNSKFFLRDSVFSGNSSDAFDGDWVDGTVENCIFENNGGDGLDFSGSNVLVIGSRFTAMGDKGISVGERSTVTIYSSIFGLSKYGVASKDLSSVEAYASIFARNEKGFSLYQKKNIFGPSKSLIYGSVFLLNKDDFDVQAGSHITLHSVATAGKTSKDNIKQISPRLLDVSSSMESGANFFSTSEGIEELRDKFGAMPATSPIEVKGYLIPNLADSTLVPLL